MTFQMMTKGLLASVGMAALFAGSASAKDFDLSGTEVTIGTAQAQVLNLGTLRMIEMLQEWGADVTRVELPNISGLEAIVAERIDIASRSSDEILSGQSRGVDVVAFAAPISTMHYAVISTPGTELFGRPAWSGHRDQRSWRVQRHAIPLHVEQGGS